MSKPYIIDQAVFLSQAEGYADGDLTLYHSFTLTDFLKAENPVDFLDKASTVRRQAVIFLSAAFIPYFNIIVYALAQHCF